MSIAMSHLFFGLFEITPLICKLCDYQIDIACCTGTLEALVSWLALPMDLCHYAGLGPNYCSRTDIGKYRIL